jgi:Holliday junction DNA helicase RuvB
MNNHELQLDTALRPRSLAEFAGQPAVKDVLEIALTAARQRGEVLEHILFWGPPGLGKTSLAYIIAHELGVKIKTITGPALQRAEDLAAIVNDLRRGDVLFIDEIHRVPRIVEEILYPAMEDFVIDIVIGKGLGAQTLRLELQPFTLIGATTRAGLLSAPLRNRFGQQYQLEPYGKAEVIAILQRSAALLRCKLDDAAAAELASRSRGTPRIANRFLRRVRDYAQVKGAPLITSGLVLAALRMLGIDADGLERMDRSILAAIIDKYSGGPVGVQSLAAAIGEEVDTLSEVYEPYLMQHGFITRTNRGRIATDRAYSLLGRSPKAAA